MNNNFNIINNSMMFAYKISLRGAAIAYRYSLWSELSKKNNIETTIQT